MSLLHYVIMVPFMFAMLVPVCYKWLHRINTGWIVLAVPIALFIYFLQQIPVILNGENISASVPWMPSLGITFTVYLDGLGLLFALLITGIGSLVVFYSIFYLDQWKEAIHHFYVYLLLFMGTMLGVVLSDNLMVMYGFWELTSISSFLLIAFWHHRERSRYGAQKSMLITIFGGLSMFAGFILLYVMAGTFSIREMIGQAGDLAGHPLIIPAMLLILFGAFTKSAQFPFSIWLPDAMEAPTPVSAYLHSATMVKAGLYLVARLSPLFASQSGWFWLITLFGLTTLIYGAYQAVKQTDLKAMLAFSTVSQLGLIMCLLGLGAASAFFTGVSDSLFYAKATTAAIFHLINHAVFKGALFMAVGIIDHGTGTRDLRKLGGLMSMMPVTFSITLIGALSMAGLPPFGGFLSKEMFFTAVLNIQQLDMWNMESWSIWIPVLAWIASVFTFVYSMILLFRTFTGKLQRDQFAHKPHEASIGLLISPVILASLAVVFGLFPNLLSNALIGPVMASVHQDILNSGDRFDVHIQFWHGWTMEVFMTMGVVVFGLVLYTLYNRYHLMGVSWSDRMSLNRLYDGGLRLVDQATERMTKSYMTGSLRRYLVYIFIFFIVALGTTMIRSEGLQFRAENYAPISIYEVIIVLVMVLSAIGVSLARHRITAIIFAGAVGYMVSLLFVLLRAPDLALTQMIIETVSVALFLLCFYHLPKLRKEATALRFKLSNLVISISVGALVTLIALGANAGRSFESISEYFVNESYTLAGGKNIVNVILVDFRGFDTMLEIVVLGIASLGIYAMIKLTNPEDEQQGERVPVHMLEIISKSSRKSNDVVLQTVSKIVIFIIVTFSLYLFLAGHNNPGGGFIGALMTSTALVLLAIAFGMKTVRHVLPLNFRMITASGLLLAFLTGIGSFAFRVPFLSHSFGHFTMPLLGSTELATAVLFDLGVYLTVVGVTMTIILTIGRDQKPWNS